MRLVTQLFMVDSRTEAIRKALWDLDKAGLLTGEGARENREAVVGSQDPQQVSEALVQLHQAGLLTGEGANNRAVLIQHKHYDCIAKILVQLNNSGILMVDNKQAHFDRLVQHADMFRFRLLVCLLNQAGFLTPENYELALQYSEILFGGVVYIAWCDVPQNFFQGYPERFTRIIEICQNNEQTAAERQQALRRYVQCESDFSHAVASAYDTLTQALLKQTIEVLQALSKNNPQEFAKQMDALLDDEQSGAVFTRIYDEAKQAIQQVISEIFDCVEERLLAKAWTDFKVVALPYVNADRFEPDTPSGRAFNALKEKHSKLSVSADSSNMDFLALFGAAAFFQSMEAPSISTAPAELPALNQACRSP